MRAIIIGAGRGQRLMPSTADAPKCFAEVQGARIIDWIVRALTQGGVSEICFIGGYRIDSVRAAYPGFVFRENADWPNNNILASLMCAEDLMDQPFLTSYADILYTPEVVRGLVDAPADIALGIDTDWVEHYRPRTCHPPHDAEKVTVADGKVTRVHRGIGAADAYGEFIGVAKFSAAGAQALREVFHRRRAECAGRPYREAALFEKAYLIHMLQDMIEQGVAMTHVDTPGRYREIDTQEDLDLAQRLWRG
ncbi:MAG: phosphocholine cytidylyltransferase family protein [Alphaproteobacteria bacterium]|nr:phosphocholine cytidylyltransferase family protein [Alphaproteobacteria bacterium]